MIPVKYCRKNHQQDMKFYFVQVVEKEFHKVIAPYKKLPYSASCIIPCSQAPFW